MITMNQASKGQTVRRRIACKLKNKTFLQRSLLLLSFLLLLSITFPPVLDHIICKRDYVHLPSPIPSRTRIYKMHSTVDVAQVFGLSYGGKVRKMVVIGHPLNNLYWVLELMLIGNGVLFCIVKLVRLNSNKITDPEPHARLGS